MKPPRAQTHYELLEVSVSASSVEIRQAFDRLIRLCADEELALYGLASPDHAAELRARLTEAVELLSDDGRRADYDRAIGLPPRDKPDSTAPRVPFEYQPPRPSATSAVLPPVEPSTSMSSPSAAAGAAAAVVVSMSAAPAEEPPAPSSSPPRELFAPPRERSAPVESPPAAAQVERPRPSAAPELAQESALAIARSADRPRPPPAPSAPLAAPAPFVVPEGAPLDGPLLRHAREHRGVSLTAMAERTRIGTKHLENLENERFDALPAVVYVRGFLMAACKELGLDGLTFARAYLLRLEQHRAKR